MGKTVAVVLLGLGLILAGCTTGPQPAGGGGPSQGSSPEDSGSSGSGTGGADEQVLGRLYQYLENGRDKIDQVTGWTIFDNQTNRHIPSSTNLLRNEMETEFVTRPINPSQVRPISICQDGCQFVTVPSLASSTPIMSGSTTPP